MMEKINVEFSRNDSVARIILNDGKGNVLDYLMMEQIQAQLDRFAQMPQLKLITWEGAGKHFSFGASVEEHQKEYAAAMLRGFHKMFFSLRELCIPALAKVSGQCLGGGLELALMCNQIFADKTARLGQPEVALGVFPPPASIILPEKIGLSRAEDLLLTGRSIAAEEGFGFGLINRVYETRADLDAGTETWIEEHILPKSASSLRFAVRAARIKFNHVLGNFLPQLETLYVSQLMNTADANEGIAAFLEKRKPVWNDA
ncbi:MAG: cyclohexa-1,5-dienecarbonyl-CoA hydratase [Haliscomenobacteraceae bacterium CHB4]|nr:Cyclohexa-1,5-dienecarbonyl-CoA hydratase [Saprospiraceae bacterium]MCE7924588.1 cyclohexa-1,5-dienecarbonyl-CoA hydratase [Haliscomenobacteraceae bacterium CHB4]